MNDIILTAHPVSKQLQDELKKAIAAIDRKLKKLSGDFSYIFKAPANFKYNELDGNTVNIQATEDITYLIKALSKMKRVETDYNQTMADLGIETYPVCKWLLVPTSAWIEDLTVLIKRAINKDLIKQLATKRSELAAFRTAEDRLTTTLNDLKELMK